VRLRNRRRSSGTMPPRYDTRGLITDVRELGFTPLVAADHHPPTIRHRRPHHTTCRTRREARGSASGSKNTSRGSSPSAVDASSATSARERNRAWFKLAAAVFKLIRTTALDTDPPDRLVQHDQPDNPTRAGRKPATNGCQYSSHKPRRRTSKRRLPHPASGHARRCTRAPFGLPNMCDARVEVGPSSRSETASEQGLYRERGGLELRFWRW
jgi:hypothetical protein